MELPHKYDMKYNFIEIMSCNPNFNWVGIAILSYSP